MSESDGMSDKVEYLCDSGQFSMSDAGGQLSVSDTGGTFMEHDLMAASTPIGDKSDKRTFFVDQSGDGKNTRDESLESALVDKSSNGDGCKTKSQVYKNNDLISRYNMCFFT